MAAVKTYNKGSKPKLRVTFTNPDNGELLDPATITVKVKKPSGGTTTATYDGGAGAVVKESTGKYMYRVLLDEAGTWKWTFTGSTADDIDVADGELVCEDPGV